MFEMLLFVAIFIISWNLHTQRRKHIVFCVIFKGDIFGTKCCGS